MISAADELAELLAEGLDLCVRARWLDAQDRTNTELEVSSDGAAWEASGKYGRHAKMHNELFPHAQVMSKSATIPLWVQDQYEKDLAAWETKARSAMIRLGYGR